MQFTPLAVAGVLAMSALLVFSRSLYRFFNPDFRGYDTYFHLYLIEEIRQNGHQLPERPTQTVTAGVYAYPYLLHWALSYLPRRAVDYLDRNLSAGMDLALFCLVVILGVTGYIEPAGVPVALVVLVATPQLVRPDQAQVIGLSTRKVGTLLTTGSILLLVIYETAQSPVLVVVSLLLASMVPLLSKFSVQVLLPVMLAFAVFVTPLAGVVLFGSFAFAVAASRGRYLTVLETHIRHLYDYCVAKQYRRFDHTLPNPVRFIQTVLAADSPLEGVRLVYRTPRLFPLFCNLPPFVALVGLGLAQYQSTPLNVGTPVLVWLAACVLLTVLTTLPHLLFLGSAERYLEYAYLPAFWVIADAWVTLGNIYHVFVIATVVIGLGTITGFTYLFREQDPKRKAAVTDIVEELQRIEPGVVLMQPSTITRRVIWETDHSVVNTLGNQASTAESVKEYNRLFPEKILRVTDDVAWLQSQFDPDWVVYDSERLEQDLSESLKPPSVEPVYRNKQFELYTFDSLLADKLPNGDDSMSSPIEGK